MLPPLIAMMLFDVCLSVCRVHRA